MDGWLRPGAEASLGEMLDDPIMQLVMARDGVSREEIEELVLSLRERLQADARIQIAVRSESEQATQQRPLAAA